MQSLRAYLRNVLNRLGRSHGDHSLHEIGRILAATLDAREVRFYDGNGQGFSADTTLNQLLEQPFEASLHFSHNPLLDRRGFPGREADAGRHVGGVSRFRSEMDLAPPQTDEERIAAFVREFDRLQHRNEFMWAGYVVRDLLPRLGFQPEDTKLVLNRLRTDEIVNVKKVPNPRNPDFPATGVQLNRRNAQVREILGLTGDVDEDESAYEAHDAPTSDALSWHDD